MSNRKYIIYKHTNLINGKVYIGQTCRNPRIRWNYGLGYTHNKHFYAAIQKYGWHNFKHEILYTDLSKEEADKLEIQLIQFYQNKNPDNCYNVALGGSTNIHYKTKEEAQQVRKKIQHNAYIKMVSNEEYAQKMRDKSLQNYYENKNNLEYKQARKKSNKKSRNKVKQLRQELRDLYRQYPDLFLIDEINLIFGYTKSKNKNKNYICNSSKKLENILNIIKTRLNKN